MWERFETCLGYFGGTWGHLEDTWDTSKVLEHTGDTWDRIGVS